jgi:predicted PurR-regulated permease PerM
MASAATSLEKMAWIFVAASLVFVLWFHLLAALLAGLLVHVLLQRLARRLAGPRLSHGSAKVVAAWVVGLMAVSVAAGAVLLLVGVARGRIGDVPALLARMAQTLEETSDWLGARGVPFAIPDAGRDAQELKAAAATWLRTHSSMLQKVGGEIGRTVFHAALGIAVGLLVFFRHPTPNPGPLARAMSYQVRRLTDAFEAVIFAQVKISAINTTLTACYLLGGLRLFGVRLPLAGTLVLVTFLTGLIPVVGNLVSNTVIVVISLGVSGWVATISLVFLILIHKLEYLTNARIVGATVHAAAWEILLALLAFEAVFGVSGLILAPVAYVYAKGELTHQGLI